jgi:uncharacterized iron-regulated membrane protein
VSNVYLLIVYMVTTNFQRWQVGLPPSALSYAACPMHTQHCRRPYHCQRCHAQRSATCPTHTQHCRAPTTASAVMRSAAQPALRAPSTAAAPTTANAVMRSAAQPAGSAALHQCTLMFKIQICGI